MYVCAREIVREGLSTTISHKHDHTDMTQRARPNIPPRRRQYRTRPIGPQARTLELDTPYAPDCAQARHRVQSRSSSACSYRADGEYQAPYMTRRNHLHGAPSLYDACEQRLLRIISNVRADPVYDLPKMSISATHDVGLLHPRSQRLQNTSERGVE